MVRTNMLLLIPAGDDIQAGEAAVVYAAAFALRAVREPLPEIGAWGGAGCSREPGSITAQP